MTNGGAGVLQNRSDPGADTCLAAACELDRRLADLCRLVLLPAISSGRAVATERYIASLCWLASSMPCGTRTCSYPVISCKSWRHKRGAATRCCAHAKPNGSQSRQGRWQQAASSLATVAVRATQSLRDGQYIEAAVSCLHAAELASEPGVVQLSSNCCAPPELPKACTPRARWPTRCAIKERC